MKGEKTFFVCQSCGTQSPKWLGRCPDCGNWNTLVEEVFEKPRAGSPWDELPSLVEVPQPLGQISTRPEPRFLAGMEELDRVLGGGVVPGSAVLIGGDPGIGKSTLVLQVLDRLTRNNRIGLYISGEESLQQIKMRAERLGIDHSPILILAETSLEKIFKFLKELQAGLCSRRFHPDRLFRRPELRPRQRFPGARGGRTADGLGQKDRDLLVSDRPCHQGRHHCRSPGPGAYGGYGSIF